MNDNPDFDDDGGEFVDESHPLADVPMPAYIAGLPEDAPLDALKAALGRTAHNDGVARRVQYETIIGRM